MLVWMLVALGAPEIPEGQTEAWSWAGGEVRRLEPQLHGRAVDGGELTQWRTSSGRVDVLGTEAVSPEVVARVGRSQAIEHVERALPLVGSGELWPARAELVWRMHQGSPRLAWRVDASTAVPPRTWRVWVDARTGETLTGTITSRSARAHVYELSPSLGEPVEVELERLTSTERLEGEYARARSCDDWTISEEIFGETTCHAASAHALPDGSGDYLFEPDPGSIDDPFAEAHVYFHVDRIASWMDERFGFDLGEPITATVNFPMANAFYGDFDGDGARDLSFGHVEESGVDFGYDADVVYHEYGHAIVGRLASDLAYVSADELGMDWTAGAINEGAADLWSLLLTGDPLTGEYAGSAFDRVAIRDLEPDRRCPEDIRGEVHADGLILGALGWNLYEDPAFGPRALEELLFGATTRWSGAMTWSTVGASLQQTAEAMVEAGALDGDGMSAFEDHLAASGMVGCERILALEDAEPIEQFLINGGLFEDLANIPASAQFTLEVPEDADRVWVQVDHDRGSDDVGFVLYGRQEAPIGHDQVGLGALGLGFAFASDYDWRIEGTYGERIELPVGSEVAPGTLYLSLASRNLGGVSLLDFQTAVVRLRGGWEADPPEEVAGGCACNSGRWSWIWVVLPLLARRRRR